MIRVRCRSCGSVPSLEINDGMPPEITVPICEDCGNYRETNERLRDKIAEMASEKLELQEQIEKLLISYDEVIGRIRRLINESTTSRDTEA
jgi:predicted nuclease with TOPRIM domain